MFMAKDLGKSIFLILINNIEIIFKFIDKAQIAPKMKSVSGHKAVKSSTAQKLGFSVKHRLLTLITTSTTQRQIHVYINVF